MPQVVHDDGELIGPLTQPVPEQKVAALRGGLLAELPEQPVHETLGAGFHPEPDAASRTGLRVPGLDSVPDRPSPR